MKESKHSGGRIKSVFCGALLALTGCVGVVGPGYVDTYVPGPDVVVFGGYGRGHFDHDYGRRGSYSRGFVGHGGGGHSGGHR